MKCSSMTSTSIDNTNRKNIDSKQIKTEKKKEKSYETKNAFIQTQHKAKLKEEKKNFNPDQMIKLQ